MKTLLAILSIFTLTSVTTTSVVEASCAPKRRFSLNVIHYTLDGELNQKGDRVTISILDYPSLTNVRAMSANESILGIEGPDANGIIIVTANSDRGTSSIILTADGKERTEIFLTINSHYQINATIDQTNFRVGETATITIFEYTLFKGLKISASSNHVEVGNIQGNGQDGTVTIKGISEGPVTITISATNGLNEKEFDLQIEPKANIEASIDKTNLKIGETATITISNPDQFINLQIQANPSGNVEIGQISSDGKVTIKALESGTTEITISADNGITYSTSIQIAERISINATISNDQPELNETVILKIDNPEEFVNLKVNADPEDAVEIGAIDNQGNIAIKIIKGGQITISVNADNALSSWSQTIVVQNKVAIQASINKNEIWEQNNAIVSISNYRELINVQVQASPTDSVLLGNIDENGNFEILGLQANNVVITITADNALAAKEFNLVINPRIAIQASIDHSDLKIGQETTIRITNSDQLINLQINAQPSESVEIGTINSDGTINVKAIKSGPVSFTISADNGISTTLNLSIDQPVPINATLANDEVWVGQTTILSINNFADLINVEVNANPANSVEIGQISSDGKVTIKALKSGEIGIMISADNAQKSEQLILKSKDLLAIDFTVGKTHLKVGEVTEIKITNFADLENLVITPDVEGIIEIGQISSDGKVTIKALQSGFVTFTISADNAISKTVDFTIDQKIQIDVNISKTNLWIGESATLNITNFDQLINVKVIAQPSANVQITALDNQGEYSITALIVGEVDIYLEADNAITPVKLIFTIDEKIEISASIDKDNLKIGESATITISNPDQLENLQISAQPSGNVIVSPIHPDGTITITAIDSGITTITITADNGISKTIDLTIAEKIAIDYTVDKNDLWTGENSFITIANFAELVNLKVEIDTSGHAEVGAIDSQGRIQVSALTKGVATVTITADNALEPIEIIFNIDQKIAIEASIDQTNLKIGETATITISNPDQLIGLKVSAEPSGNVQIGEINPDGTITITAIDSGSTSITISADNGISKTLTLTVDEKIAITYNVDETNLWVGKTATITLDNFAEFVNLQVKANPSENIQIEPINNKGQIIVTALQPGITTITLNADNALAPVEINFNITPKVNIDAQIDKTDLWINDLATITINNLTDLINPKVAVDTNGLVEIGAINPDGTIAIMALHSGTTTITISADNAVDQTFTLIISAKITIGASIDKTDLKIGENATITINNPDELIGLKVNAQPSDNVVVSGIRPDGTVIITAITPGTTTITITADNGISKTFTLTIAEKIAIDASINDSNLWVDKTAVLSINNFDQFVNLKVVATGEGSVQIGPIDSQGKINIVALTPGEVTLTISANNAIANKIIAFTITPKVNIDASIINSHLWVGNNTTLTISNHQELVNMQISASPNNIVQIGNSNANGIIIVQGLNEGSATITISADNAISKTIDVTVSQKIQIAATIDKTNLKIGENATITVANANQLENIQTITSPNNIVQVSGVDSNGEIILTALDTGTATITITANNGISKTLNVTIVAKIAIQATINTNSIWTGEMAILTISNFNQLVNLKATANDNLELGSIDSQGRIIVSAIKNGITPITITASNAISPFVINVTTATKLTINANIDKTTIRVGETATLTISNFTSLQNLQVKTEPSNNVSLSAINAQGQVTITGMVAGQTTLSVTATNGFTYSVLLTVPSKVAIIASANPTSIAILGTSRITISNIGELVNPTARVINGSSLISINTGDISKGTITITSILSLPGSITVRLDADNAIGYVDITITIRLL